MWIRAAIGLMCACAAALPAAAQDKAVAPAVTVTAVRNPVDKSYRKMVRGMELFEEMRAMAPNATLRYKLLPRKPGTNLDGIQLGIEANSFSIPVDVAADRTFTLERDPKALAEDASVRSNRRALSMTWRAEIRTPGLAADARRLGDLRLECHVGMEADLVSNVRSRSFFGGPVDNSVLRRRGYCDDSKARYLYFSERPLFGVTLRSGTRREALPVDELYAGLSRNGISRDELPFCDCEALLDRAYFLPLGDRSWPDDTLVEFEYMDGQSARTDGPDAARRGISIGTSTKSEVSRSLGQGTVIRFDTGYEEWIYRIVEGTPVKGAPIAKNEFVVLFSPSGIATKTRLREEFH